SLLSDTTNTSPLDLTTLMPNNPSVKDLASQLSNSQIDNEIKNVASDVALLINGPGGLNFDFPIFQDPLKSAFMLLLGHDADLFEFTANFKMLPSMQEGLTQDLSFFGAGVNFTFDMGIDASFRLAYDTFGIREFFHDFFDKNNPQVKPLDLLDG